MTKSFIKDRLQPGVGIRRTLKLKGLLSLVAIPLLSYQASAQIAPVNVQGLDGVSALVLANAIKGTGIQSFENVTLVGKVGTATTKGGGSSSAGTFSGGENIIGFGAGIILSTGGVFDVPGPNSAENRTQSNGTGGDADLAALINANVSSLNDKTVLEFDFVPTYPTIAFRYVFGSDEYNEYANSQFNDVFGFFVNGTQPEHNVARIPGTSLPVAINSVNGGKPLGTNAKNPQYFVNNSPQAFNLEMDGFTVVLTAQASVIPGQVNHIKIAIADLIDSAWDSNVFIEESSFVSGHAPIALADGYKTPLDTPLTVIDSGVLANDTDEDNNLDHAQLIDKPAHGTVVLNDAGGFTYTPQTGYSGPDSFTYLAIDATNIQSNLATVSITVGAANSVPSGSSNTISVLKNAVNPVPLSGFIFVDSDAGNSLTAVKIQGITIPAGASLQINGVDVTVGQTIPAVVVANGQLKFTPASGEFGVSYAQISYQVSDGMSLSGTQQLVIDVQDSSPEISVYGNNIEITNGDATPSASDHTYFGSVTVTNGSVNRVFTIANDGNADLNVEAVSITGPHASDFNVTIQPNVNVTPGATTTFTVQFDPTADGLRTAQVRFVNSDGDESPYTFTIQGNGGAVPVAPEIAISGNNVEIASGDTTPASADHTDFGVVDAVNALSRQRIFSISNSGTDVLNITGSVMITGAADFSLTTPPSSSSVAINGSTSFAITFAPTSIGLKTATVTVSSNDDDEPTYTFSIQGTGAGVPLVTTLPATDVKTYVTTLKGSLNPKGASATVYFEYSTDSTFTNDVFYTLPQDVSAADSAEAVETIISSLMPETLYYFRIVATNSLGTSYGSPLSFTTGYACIGKQPLTDSDGLIGGGLVYRPLGGLINNAGRVTFNAYGMIGTGSIAYTNEQLLLSDASGSLRVIAREATEVSPGQTLTGTFSQILLSETGRSVTLERLNGAPVTSDYLYLSSPADGLSLSVVSREGDSAPGGGTFLSGVNKPVIDSLHRIYFFSSLDGVSASRNNGIWYEDAGTLLNLVKKGDNVSSAVGDLAWLNNITPYLSAGGDGCVFQATLQSNPDDSTQKTNGQRNLALFSVKPGSPVTMLVRKGDEISGTGGGKISNISGLARSQNEDHAYLGFLGQGGGITASDDQLLVAIIDGVSHVVAREGTTPIVDGLTVQTFGDFYICTNDEVIFKAVLKGATATTDNVICSWSPTNGMSIIAREGSPAGSSGLDIGTIQVFSVSDNGMVALQCILSDGNYGLLRDKRDGNGMQMLDSSGPTSSVILNGVVRTIQSFSLYSKCVNTSGGGGGMGSAINNSGETFVVLSLDTKNFVARIYR
ncbi:hypothetical protein SAMN02745166_02351 [Prosthecobacter debontii]|uniref:HYDIN/VesB/CFA65-like Ig-like domain-containing protein n=1 Tax=Prosthecobacter debontii TaxID=48467 RepID=A0A1T4Y464_9BACT|nr:choice-of-anchor L domain-containing protein [Prosthecobacter debontii]SKA96065.1 hypothetical protein SAMN02745166_02351 [Prosthecobacter debontii]